MYLIVEFDLNMDLVDVPGRVVANRDSIRQSFLHWGLFSAQ